MIRYAEYDDIPYMAGLLAELFTIEDDFSIDPLAQISGKEYETFGSRCGSA